jgi:hypothetical protein
MARIILKGDEEILAAGIGNSTNAGNAKLARVYNPSSSADAIVYVVDPTGANEYSGIGSVTLGPQVTEFFEKQPTYNIYGNATIHVAPVGYGAN